MCLCLCVSVCMSVFDLESELESLRSNLDMQNAHLEEEKHRRRQLEETNKTLSEQISELSDVKKRAFVIRHQHE